MDDYDEFGNYDDDILDDEPEFDCGWSGESGQLCDDIGTESCSFFCPLHQAMFASLGDNPKPPTWAEEKAEWFEGDGNDEQLPAE